MPMHYLLAANTANPTVVKAGPARLHGIQAFNINAAAAYLKLYDKASAPDENDTPKKVILIPGATTGGVANITFHPYDDGASFLTGLAYRVVTVIADNGTTAPTASQVIVNLDYK